MRLPAKATLVTRTEAERHSEYRRTNPDKIDARNRERRKVTYFRPIDGEGEGTGADQKYALLSVGTSEPLINRAGIHWKEAFKYLYKEFEKEPNAAYVGFFLRYDFNKILMSLPEETARELLTEAGKKSRERYAVGPRPVRCDGWEFDILGFKRLQIRPLVCMCYQDETICLSAHKTKDGYTREKCEAKAKYKTHCEHRSKYKKWMFICDAGPFFQESLLAVVDPGEWKDDPDGPVCTAEEYDLLEKGKAGRSNPVIDDEAIRYNHLENTILARLMMRLSKGLEAQGINLRNNQWYGPGAAAQAWLRKEGIPTREDIELRVPAEVRDILQSSYYGGWFEIFSHGLIDEGWNYDINSAYPYAISELPCIMHGKFKHRKSGNVPQGKYVLVNALCLSARDNKRIGPMPHRQKDGSILRPAVTRGWYWLSELEASKEAGLLREFRATEYLEYIPCATKCSPPCALIRDMYYERLRVGKNSARGMSQKLIINSDYGKFAQSVGSAPFGNWFYASLITSSCRTQILQAIATHPGKANSTLMIATDGVTFDSPHPVIDAEIAAYMKETGKRKDDRLGKWDRSKYPRLILFKPGVYWYRVTKDGKEVSIQVKTRGVPKKNFANNISFVERYFENCRYSQSFPGRDVDPEVEQYLQTLRSDRLYGKGDAAKNRLDDRWPALRIHIDFAIISCLTALVQNKWHLAGQTLEPYDVYHDSNPCDKRRGAHWNPDKQRIDSYMYDVPDPQTTPYKPKNEPDSADERETAVGLEDTIMTDVQLLWQDMRGDSRWADILR